MYAYHELTERGRLRRKRRLAQAALQHYGLPDARLIFLRDVDNTLYRVEAADQRYVLRMHSVERHSPAALRSELHWLAALRHEAGLLVPEPALTRDGAVFVDVAAPDVPQPRRCVLLRWLPGRVRTEQPWPSEIARIGALMARLHCHAERYDPPDFARQSWDWARLFGPAAGLWRNGPLLLSPADLEICRAASQRIAATMEAVGQSRATYGLIHSDLNLSNIVFHGDQVGAIDFEECGLGYFLFDMAVTLYELSDFPAREAALRAAFLDGYARERALPAGSADHLPAFEAMRRLDLMSWILNMDDVRENPRAPRFMSRQIEQLRAFVAG
jgi:Ser/Thr protein kinase RdoA (MazF antagonist)